MPMLTILTASLLGGCAYNEQIRETEIKGKLVVPRAAATRNVKASTDPLDLSTVPLEDPRLLGPIYIGAYSAIDENSRPYPIPYQGPVIDGEEGDTFPYGGTGVGRFDFACYKFLACKVTTGRFADYEDMMDYFANVLQNPIKDNQGVVLTSDVAFEQQCLDYYYEVASDNMAFIGPSDFTLEGDNYVAEFELFHTTFVPGMAVWGFMDAPQISADKLDLNGTFSTCSASGGRTVYKYDQTYDEGGAYTDILNRPTQYIDVDDWVTTGVTVGDDPSAEITLNLDIPIISEQ